MVAIESKDWIDKKGKPKSKAGFAKVLVGKETKENAQKLVDAGINEPEENALLAAELRELFHEQEKQNR